MRRIVFVLPGGGARGMIQAAALAKIEQMLGMQIFQLANLIIGGSVGSIIGGMLAAGVKATIVEQLFYNNAKSYFPRTNSITNILLRLVTGNNSLYDAQAIVSDVLTYSSGAKMRDMRCPYVAVTANVNTRMPLLMSSEDPIYQNKFLADVVANSFAAPYFFGLRNNDIDQITYGDPGIGGDANPIMIAWTEVIRRGWHQDGITDIYMIGTGLPNNYTPYSETRKWGFIRQSVKTLRFAAEESDATNQHYAEYFDMLLSNVNIYTLNPTLDGPADFANVSKIDYYSKLGSQAVDSIDLDPLIARRAELLG